MYGIKVWCLADNSNSYAVNLQVYAGLGPDVQREQHQGARVVRDLISMLQGGYSITDKFFTGVALAKDLKQNDCTLLGTMRKTKKDVPALREVRGRSVHSSKFLLHEGLTMVSYIPKKNRNVIVLSSRHQGASIEGEEHDFKPEMILDYNKIKSVVVTFVREYRCLRTSGQPCSSTSSILQVTMPSVLGQIMIQIITWESLIDAESFSCSWLKIWWSHW